MPPRAWFQPLSVFALLFASAGARAQDAVGNGVADESILFQEIPSVYGASKHEQKTSEAPSSVSIITAADIQHHGYRTRAGALRCTDASGRQPSRLGASERESMATNG